MASDRLFRVGEKLISMDRVMRLAERALEMREKGLSQQEVANKLKLDRSFVSRLETVGEIRKGNRVAVIGFPLANAAELTSICRDYGLDFYLLLNNRERWELVQGKQALDFFNRISDLIATLREFDTLVMVTSEKWYNLAEVMLDNQIVHVDLGPTPIEEDRFVDVGKFKEILSQVLKP